MVLRFVFALILIGLPQDDSTCVVSDSVNCCRSSMSRMKEESKTFVLTPLRIEAQASYIDSERSTSNLQITFNAGSVNHAALLKIPLVSAGHLDDLEPLAVEITVANDVTIGKSTDSDIRFGLSDGTRFVGFETTDAGNSASHSPCYGVQGTSGQTLSSVKTDSITPKPSDSFYPGQFVFTFKLDERWGSCYTAHDGGFTRQTRYDHRLMLSKGLNLEVYKSDAGERIGIKYIKVTIITGA